MSPKLLLKTDKLTDQMGQNRPFVAKMRIYLDNFKSKNEVIGWPAVTFTPSATSIQQRAATYTQ